MKLPARKLTTVKSLTSIGGVALLSIMGALITAGWTVLPPSAGESKIVSYHGITSLDGSMPGWTYEMELAISKGTLDSVRVRWVQPGAEPDSTAWSEWSED